MWWSIHHRHSKQAFTSLSTKMGKIFRSSSRGPVPGLHRPGRVCSRTRRHEKCHATTDAPPRADGSQRKVAMSTPCDASAIRSSSLLKASKSFSTPSRSLAARLQMPARDSRNATISWPLRTSKTSPASTTWFQVLPSSAGKCASSVNWSGVAFTSASSPSSEITNSTS
jgi:hypothetical protein